MSIRPWKGRVALVLPLTALAFFTTGAAADWLVTRDGQRVETRGGWEVRGQQVIFTLPNGTLSSLRLKDVDLDASAAVTEEARQQAAAPPEEETAEEPAREPVLRITDRDVARGTALQGPDLLADRFRTAHRYRNLDLLAGLVFWQDVPEPLRQVVRKDFTAMLERQLVDVRLVPLTPEEARIRPEVDGVVYEPNLPLTHRLELRFDNSAQAPGPEGAGEAPAPIVNLYVGERLGTYLIAGPRPAGSGTEPEAEPGEPEDGELEDGELEDGELEDGELEDDDEPLDEEAPPVGLGLAVLRG